jgi:hypothetical protein
MRSVARTPGELRGPCRKMVIDSPVTHPAPVIGRAVFHVNRNGWRFPLRVIPPETETAGDAPSRANSEAVQNKDEQKNDERKVMDT